MGETLQRRRMLPRRRRRSLGSKASVSVAEALDSKALAGASSP
jgi:hypothetical protein